MALKMIRVKWHDARLFTGTFSEDECKQKKMCLFDSLGYLIQKDSTTTVIASEHNNEGDCRDITLIPTGSVVSISDLEITK